MQAGKKKILLVSTYIIPRFSGSGRNAYSFARALSLAGWPVRLLSFNRNFREKRKELAEEVKISRIPYFPGNLILKGFSLLFLIPGYLYQLIRHDIILVYGSRIPGYQLLLLFGHWFGKRVIFRSLLPGVDDLESIVRLSPGIFRRFHLRLFRNLDDYFSINPEFSRIYRNYFPDAGNIYEGLQGVNIHEFRPPAPGEKLLLRKKYNIDPEIPLLVSVGYVIPRKGIIHIINALEDIGIPFLYLVIGEYRFDEGHFLHHEQAAAAKVVEEGKSLLGDRIRFTGEMDQVGDYLRMADLFIHHASQEGFPNAILEAMASGLCVLCREFPGINHLHLRSGRDLIIFKDRIPSTLIMEYIRDRDKREQTGNHARQFVCREADFQILANKLIDR